MPTRNTGIFCAESEIIKALGGPLKNPPDALDRLENHFKDSLLIAAGAAQNVARHAEPQKFRALRSQKYGECFSGLGKRAVGQQGPAESAKCKSTDPIFALAAPLHLICRA